MNYFIISLWNENNNKHISTGILLSFSDFKQRDAENHSALQPSGFLVLIQIADELYQTFL